LISNQVNSYFAILDFIIIIIIIIIINFLYRALQVGI